ncbi:MAG: RsiV family protein [Planctomycetota bacterium]
MGWTASALSVGFLGGAGVAALRERPLSIRIERFERASPARVSEREDAGAVFSVDVPRVTGGCGDEARAALNAAWMLLVEMPIRGQGARSLEAQAASLLTSWERCRAEHPTAASTASWWRRRRTQVLYSGDGLVTLQVSERWHTGGAHSNSRTRIATYDPASGRRVDARSLVAPADRSRLAAAVVQGVLARGVPCDRAALVARASATENVAVIERGLLFSFDPYEVSGFPQGTIQHVVPWSALHRAGA